MLRPLHWGLVFGSPVPGAGASIRAGRVHSGDFPELKSPPLAWRRRHSFPAGGLDHATAAVAGGRCVASAVSGELESESRAKRD